MLDANPRRVSYETGLMGEPPVTLNGEERVVVLRSFVETCRVNGWELHVVHVRSNHCHLLLTAEAPPERVMTKLKAYATRHLNRRYGRRERRWAVHGSTRWLWDVEGAIAAAHYAIGAQGERMALYVGSPAWLPRR